MNATFETLFKDFAEIRNEARAGEPQHGLYAAQLGTLTTSELSKILEYYSQEAVQEMGLRRGVTTNPKAKKGDIIPALVKQFYDEAAIKQALQKLSAPARDGLQRIKQAGGAMPVKFWRDQMEGRYGTNRVDNILAEMVASVVALYGQPNYYNRLDFGSGYRRGLVEKSGSFYGTGDNVLWSPPQVLALVTKDDALSAQVKLQPYSMITEPKIKTPASFENLLADIIAFLRYVEQNRVKLLQSGDIGKRDFTKINDLLTVKENRPLSDIRKLDETGRLDFLWSVLLETKLLTGRRNGADEYIVVNSQQSDEFYALPRYRQARLLATAWAVSTYNDFRHIPTLVLHSSAYNSGPTDVPDRVQQVAGRTFLLGLLQNLQHEGKLPAGRWLNFRSLTKLINETDPEFLISATKPINPNTYYSSSPYYQGFGSTLKKSEKSRGGYAMMTGMLPKRNEDWELVEGEWLAQVLREPLAWLGLAELGENPEGRPGAFRLTELGEAVLADRPTQAEQNLSQQLEQLAAVDPNAHKVLLVQPNFDVMVLAPLQNMATLRQIDRFADQSSLGDVAMYRISKESMLRGFRGGLTGAEVLYVLEENSRVPVAQNVASTIRDWASEFERLVLYENTNVLETPTPELLDQLLQIPATVSLLVKRLAPTFALVRGDPSRLDPFLQQLQSGTKGKTQPVFLDYAGTQPGILSFEGQDVIKLKAHSGNPYLYYRLGQFAELVEWNAAQMSATFRLTAAAGQRAQQMGLTYDKVAEFLMAKLPVEKRGRLSRPGQIPPDVRLALRGWLGYYGRPVASKAILFKVKQSSQLDDIFDLPEFEPALLERPTATSALIRESHFAALRERLAALGMPLEAPEFDPTPAEIEPPANVISLPSPAEPPAKGKRGRAPKAESKPKETAAERERRKREEDEAAPFGGFGGRGLPLIVGPNGVDLLSTLQMMGNLSGGAPGRGTIPLPLSLLMGDEFDDEEYDDDDDFEPPPPRRR